MKPLPPTLRLNRRYILVEIMTDGQIPSQKELYIACANAVQNLFGDSGFAEIRPAVIWSEGTYAIIRCTRNEETRMIAAVACVVKAGQLPAGSLRLRTVTTSGTVKGAQKAVTPRDKNYLKEDNNT